ncbi:hypothetical protein PtA15_11A417 [Puccinia triticina]|nr:uncharacterized protein PtA15_11A417 [Puccinia triticina]WAQ89726.1 hypothetical protein PtA15_11A417 [Puccinia triticina]
MVPGTTSSVGHLVGFLEEPDEIDASTDDEEEEEEEGDEREGEGSEIHVVGGSGRGRATGEAEEPSDPVNARSQKGLKMERKTSKAVEDTERIGGQLAGLETGQIAEQVEIDDDEEEEEEEDGQAPAEQAPQSQTAPAVPMDEDEQEEEPAMGGPYSQPTLLSTTPSILLPAGQQPSAMTDLAMSDTIPGLHLAAANLSQTSYAPSPDHHGPITHSSAQSLPSIVYPGQPAESALDTNQGFPPAPLPTTLGDQPAFNHPSQPSVQDPDPLDGHTGPVTDAPALNVPSGPEDPSPAASTT